MKIEFWGATREVTGSCFLIEINGRHLLVECGLVQGEPADEARNRAPFPFDPRRLDAVILTHAHLDHSGRLPLLVKAGYRGPVYTHPASRDLARIMLKDAGYLNEKEVEWDNRKRQRKHLPLLEPLYTMTDAQAAMRRFKAVGYGETVEILQGVTLRLADAGHILGSAIVELRLEEGGVRRKIVFSGDLGHTGAPILRDPAPVKEADLVVMESTYGDRTHRSWEDTWAELDEVFGDMQQGRGNILIPAFAVGRTQELLYAFKRNFQRWNLGRWAIFLDSPMAIEATEVYARHYDLYDREARGERRHNGDIFDLPNLHLSRTAQQSMRINRIESGAIIIAGSGMCEGGRIKHHFKHNIWRRQCQVMIVGFQARGTLGRSLVEGVDTIHLWGEAIRVAAKIRTIGGFSAHADCNGLAEWYGGFKDRPPVVLVHGEPQAMDPFAARLKSHGAQQVFTPAHGAVLDLVKLRLKSQ
ncbi:MAG: MBL fold metallo-hydrolase [Gammaproteobacteria bacterium]|jgi:metallo-beta-lactamase family protein